MQIVDVIPRDVHYLLDFSKENLKDIKTILDNMQFNCDLNDPEHVRANDYLHKVMYPLVKSLLEDVEQHVG